MFVFETKTDVSPLHLSSYTPKLLSGHDFLQLQMGIIL